MMDKCEHDEIVYFATTVIDRQHAPHQKLLCQACAEDRLHEMPIGQELRLLKVRKQ